MLAAPGASSFKLGTPLAFAELVGTGSSWQIVQGQQDTGWLPITLPTSWTTSTGSYTPSARLQGDIVRLRGMAWNQSGVSAQTVGTLPSAVRPADSIYVPTFAASGITSATQPYILELDPSGRMLYIAGVPNNYYISFDGLTYTLS